MIVKTVNLKNETGMHARPASELAKTAMKYDSEIKLKLEGKEINAKSVLSIMSAGIKQNTEIKIVCEGTDEKEAMEDIEKQFENNFGE